jgi:hypothetical protein
MVSGCRFVDAAHGIDSRTVQLHHLIPVVSGLPPERDQGRDLRSQGDYPFQWTSGPPDYILERISAPVPVPTPPPAPAPQPLPASGPAITTADLNLRRGAGTQYTVMTVMPLGSRVEMLKAHWRAKDWRYVRYSQRRASGIYAVREGWCHGGWLAAERAERPDLFADVTWTHRLRWWFAGTNVGDPVRVADAAAAMWASVDSWSARCGIEMVRLSDADKADAHLWASVVAHPCGDAPACWSSDGRAPAEIFVGSDQWNGADGVGGSWWPRRWRHELGHHFHIWDHYNGSRGDFLYGDMPYVGVMGNLTDQFGRHLTPDEDECEAVRLWLQGKAPKVSARDMAA